MAEREEKPALPQVLTAECEVHGKVTFHRDDFGGWWICNRMVETPEGRSRCTQVIPDENYTPDGFDVVDSRDAISTLGQKMTVESRTQALDQVLALAKMLGISEEAARERLGSVLEGYGEVSHG